MSRRKKTTLSQNIPLFLEKLTNILEDHDCEEYISWTSSADAFNIKDINKFTDVVLPKYFKHNNFSSFIRQLNMYGFSKIRHDEGENVYMNPNFRCGEKELLLNIKRKINQVEKEDKVAIYSPDNNNLSKELTDLKSRQRGLESMCKQLIDQNNRIMEENNSLMKKLTTEQKEKNNKMEQLLVSLIMARGNNQLALPSSQQPRMLSLTNQAQPDYMANFQGFREFIEENNGISRMQQALRKFQNEQKKRNKSKNFTIVNQPQQPKVQKSNSKKSKNDENDNSMLSLGQFLNFESSHNNQQTPI